MGSLGMPEILIILVIALIIFGPRKLPELGKTLGKSLAQFRRASEDFKRQWEDEVELERRRIEPPSPPRVERSSDFAASESPPVESNDAAGTTPDESQPLPAMVEATAAAQHEATAAQETKRDWM
ncbi:MAG TPA: twin-arginine translocase TatA/TatE family subunit [Blastocatellia bacterium]|nr:twin-arginine translocase TatA/TatE family subunit [Blastocatellia bacterium]